MNDEHVGDPRKERPQKNKKRMVGDGLGSVEMADHEIGKPGENREHGR